MRSIENFLRTSLILRTEKFPKIILKVYSSDQSHFLEINVKLAEKNKYATHSVQRSLEMCENKEKPSVSEDFRQKKFYQ